MIKIMSPSFVAIIGIIFVLLLSPVLADELQTKPTMSPTGDFRTYLTGLLSKAQKGDHEAAKELVEMSKPLAEEYGDVLSQLILGSIYYGGWGVPQDFVEAVRWFRKAAEQGEKGAQTRLGTMYGRGEGVKKDYSESVRWFRMAAEQGEAEAQFMLGGVYIGGGGIPQDYILAHMWLNLAASQEYKPAYGFREELSKKMTPTQLGEAQRLARQWKPKTPSPAHPQEASGSQPAASGTGFVVSRKGHVLTNNHVIEGCKSIHTTNEGRKQPLTVVATDSENDLALLKLPAPSPNIARFREGRTIRAGDGVVAVGFPLHGLLAAEANVTTGTVSALAGLGNDTRFLQITAPIQPGNSGGPLFDQSGNVVGVIVSTLNALNMAKATGSLPQNVNFAINGAVAKSFLDANSVEYEVASSGKRLETSDVGVQAKKFTLLLECFE